MSHLVKPGSNHDFDGKELRECNSVRYGELVVLGYNGSLPQDQDQDRRKSKFSLYKNRISNGVKPVGFHKVNDTQKSEFINNAKLFTASYTIIEDQSIVVQYDPDRNTDMFQIGRSSDVLIDFIVAEDTISRFACRIIVDRNPPYTARIYAAGFDAGKNIFLGENATKWNIDTKIDGLTSNGILIMHPQNNFSSGSQPGIWREISVNGGIYHNRESRSKTQKLDLIESENNILRDGTLIDLFGATLLWRSADGLTKSLSCEELEHEVRQINASCHQCSLGLKCPIDKTEYKFYIYLNCGHVHGEQLWGENTCTVCGVRGSIVKLQIGIETAFFVGKEGLTYCFSPCGHAASEKTVKYWSVIPIHHVCHGITAACPFCATPLNEDPGYIKINI